MSSPQSSFKKVNEAFGIHGALSTEEDLASLKESYNSVLYLCPDTTEDCGCFDGGFAKLVSTFGTENVIALPVTMDLPAFRSDEVYHFMHALAAYEAFENAIETLRAPTIFICKTARRASAVVATYLGVRNRLSSKEVHEKSAEMGFTYLGSEPLRLWSSLVLSLKNQQNRLLFRQFFEKESSTYSYLLADAHTKDALLIDPVLETIERDAQYVRELGLSLRYCLNTHMHADHITGSGLLKKYFPDCKSVIAEAAGADADIKVNDGDRVVFGQRYLTMLATPGHTNGCLSFVLDDCSLVFTGDTLLIRGCGRTDFQQGSSVSLYESVHSKLFYLPKNCVVYPAHNYSGVTCSTIAEEMAFNPRLKIGTTIEQFQGIMAGLNLPNPAKIDIALPANLKDGVA